MQQVISGKIKSKMIIANAGSGKTYSIVQHIKGIIEAGFQPSSILCITFTNSGRDEMQARLQKDIPNLKSLPKIVTFHSLCKEIIDTFTHELQMPYDYTIVDSDFEMQNAIENCLLQNEEIKAFISKFRISPSGFSGIMEAFLGEYHKLNYNKEARLQQICEIFELEPQSLLQKLELMKEVLQNIPSQMLQEVGGKVLEDALPRIFEIEKKYQAMEVDETSIDDFEELCQIAGKSTKKNGDYLIYKEFLRERQEGVKDISTFELCYALNEIANEVIDEIEKTKRNLRKYTFNDLIHKALQILQDDELKDFAIFKFGSKFSHILVDEAQDTNEQQWSVLFPFIEESIAVGMVNSSLFIVGDTKQTIYSFQGAKSTIMEEVYERYSRILEKAYLTKSFRTTKPVLDVINNLSFLNQEHPHISSFENNDGFVELVCVNQKIEEEELEIAKKTVEMVKSLIGKRIFHEKFKNKILEPSDFAILLKRRSPKVIDSLKEQFFQAKIPASFNDKIDYKQSFCVLDFIACLKLCIIEEDSLSIYSLLKSPIFNLKESDFEKEFTQATSCEEILEKFPIVREFVAKFREILNTGGIYIFFKRIFTEFSGKYSTQEQNILEGFIEQASSALQYCPISFIEEFEESNAKHTMKSSATNCVTCTTVHASKGLEYPIVIYIEAHGNSSRPQTLSVQSGIILHNSSQKKRGQKMQEILDIKKGKDKAEDERLYYVAISRSAFGFCCIASFTRSESVESFSFMLQNSLQALPLNVIEKSTDGFFTKITYEQSSNLRIVEDLPQTQVEVFQFGSVQVPKLLVNESEKVNIGEKFGTFVHSLFENSNNELNFEDFLQFYEVAETSGVEFETLFVELKHKVESINAILQETFQPIDIRKEHEITFNGKILRIDALYFCKDEIIIIDYKTQKPIITNEIQDQLESYIKAISQIHKSKVRAFVVWFANFPQEQILQQVELLAE